MMKKLLFTGIVAFLTAILWPFARPCYAQQASLSVIQINNLPDTVYAGVPYDSIAITVKNQSNNFIFQDTIYIFMKQDDSLATNIATFIFEPNGSIQAGSVTTLFTSGFFFTSTVFKPGGNTVVVWPFAKSAATFDSLLTGFYFDSTNTGITNQSYQEKGIQLMPNPAHFHFFVSHDNGLKQVRIFSVQGNLIYDRPFTDRKINIEAFKQGAYIVELSYKNGRKVSRKIWKW